MRFPRTAPGTGNRERRGFSLVEAAISIVIVGTMLVAALNAAGMAGIDRAKTLWRIQGQQLASTLMNEVVARVYEDPEAPSGGFGLDAGESGTDRSTFDDVDDFHGYLESPPRSISGETLTLETYWTWTVTIERVAAAAPGGAAVDNESGVKRITVGVKRQALPVASLVALKTGVD